MAIRYGSEAALHLIRKRSLAAIADGGLTFIDQAGSVGPLQSEADIRGCR